MSTKYFNSLGDYANELKKMQQSISPQNRKSWLKRCMGETIRDLIYVSFYAGKDGDGNQWVSSSANTKFGGRFAASYNIRPSEEEVTADKVRLTDEGTLRDSYKILTYDADEVTVGPKGDRNINIATRAESIWGNAIAGWGKFRERVALLEINKVWEHFANGVPLSRIRKPNYRASGSGLS